MGFFFFFFGGFFVILAHKLKQTHVCCSLFLGWGIYWEIIILKPNSKGYFDLPSHILEIYRMIFLK